MAWKRAKDSREREHVTYYFEQHPEEFRLGGMRHAENLSHIRLTVDELADFQLVTQLIEKLGTEAPWLDYANEVISHPNKYPQGIRARN